LTSYDVSVEMNFNTHIALLYYKNIFRYINIYNNM